MSVTIESIKKIEEFEKGPVRRSLFSNGAVSLFHEVKGRESATVNLYFLVGSQNEKKNEYGTAHLLEHMMFKENSGEYIVRKLESLGAEVNAYTYKEYTCFEMGARGVDLEVFLPLFLRLILKPTFTEEDFLQEKKVVMQEILEDKDDHEIAAYELLLESLYEEAQGHPVAGTLKSVEKITYKDLMSYHQKYYTPSRMLLTVTSGKKFKNFEELFLKSLTSYTSLKKAKPVRLKPKDLIFKPNSFKKTIRRDIETPILMMGIPAPSLGSRYYYDYLVLEDILFNGLTSRLFIELREKEPLVYSLGSDYASFLNSGHFLMTFRPPAIHLLKVKKIVLKVLSEYAEVGIEETLIEESKRRILSYWKMAFDFQSERADFLSMQEIYNYDFFKTTPQERELQKVSSERIKKVLKLVLKDNYFELVVRGNYARN